jgi:hypothetical protein
VGETMMRQSETMRAASRLLLSHPIVCLLAALAAAVVLGVLGPIKVVHAADVALEGENFANKPPGATIVNDTLFSGGQALKFTADGTASHTDTVTCSTPCDVVLMARAGQSGGRPSFSVNGSTPQAITTSNQVAPEPYTFMNLPAGSIRVTASGTGTGHNAFLDVAKFPADGGGGGTPSAAACADGLDNDGDGKTDFGGTNGDPGCTSATDDDETDPAGGTDPVFVGAGDIASCASTGDEATAALLDDIVAKAPSTTVFTTGDDAYESGTATEFTSCYNPTWGRHQAITRPTVGNHEYYSTANASGYFGYFGSILTAAGDTGQGYYSYDLGSWHMIALNSNCSFVACAAGSTQEQWLRADLAAHSNAACTLAYWHHPRFSSKLSSGGNSSMKPFWEALYTAKAEVVLNGHIHNYERFAPQTPSGGADPAQGIREFVVGTGGKSLNTFTKKGVANSQVRLANAYGVLKLTLHPSSYEWQFVTAPGGTVADSGSGSCHS